MFNSYQQMLDLQANKLAVVSVNENLSTFKYHRKVMHDYLWSNSNGTMECRGHTYDNITGELVVAAPRKSFNYLENSWGKELALDALVRITKKFNGFLACVSGHNGKLVVSTTGSTKSDFVKMAKESLIESVSLDTSSTLTDFYEIIHENDPHVVYEGHQRAEYLGSRSKVTGEFFPANLSEPMQLSDALEISNKDRGEGFMMYAGDDLQKAYKLKSPYYVGKKKLMRMQEKNVNLMYDKGIVQYLPEMWNPVVKDIAKKYTKEDWIALPEQERRAFLETLI